MLSSRIAPMTKVDRNNPNYIYYSPVEAERFEGLPVAYIETAEFDCLHDDGIMQKAETTKTALASRIAFVKKVIKRDN